MKYRKMPVVIEAFQLPEQENWELDYFFDWAEENNFINWKSGKDGSLEITTLEGVLTASPGDFIIKGVGGEFYPCKKFIFKQTYEPA